MVDTFAHDDPATTYLDIAGERLVATPEHPFYTKERGWVDAGELQLGEHIRQADGEYGAVQAVEVEQRPQMMYNLTVATAHTFFVGDNQWLVHNSSSTLRLKRTYSIMGYAMQHRIP